MHGHILFYIIPKLNVLALMGHWSVQATYFGMVENHLFMHIFHEKNTEITRHVFLKSLNNINKAYVKQSVNDCGIMWCNKTNVLTLL